MFKKFSPMRFTAATEEAAIEGALQLVGATRDEVSYDLVSQTAKGVTVRIRPLEDPATQLAPELAAQMDTETAENEVEEDEAEAPLHIDSMHDYDDTDEDESGDEAIGDDEDDESDNDNADDESGDNEESANESDDVAELDEGDDELDFDAELELEGDEYDEDELDEEPDDEAEIDAESLERALELARAMLDKMGLDAQANRGRTSAPDIVPISIDGEDVGILIGKHGATLQSFQYLMNLTLNNESENMVRVTVDAGNYRARREESLQAVARSTAQRVRRENRPIKMEAMPSNERRIVHDFLKNEAGVSTQSEGREPHRCIVVAPAESDYRGATDENIRLRRGMGGYGRSRGGRNRRS